jgi:hypothetical protein
MEVNVSDSFLDRLNRLHDAAKTSAALGEIMSAVCAVDLAAVLEDHGRMARELFDMAELRARVVELEARIPTRIYCRVCGGDYPILIDEPRQNAPGDGDDDTAWGDLCCGRCRVVLVTVEYGNWPPPAEPRAPRGAEGE